MFGIFVHIIFAVSIFFISLDKGQIRLQNTKREPPAYSKINFSLRDVYETFTRRLRDLYETLRRG